MPTFVANLDVTAERNGWTKEPNNLFGYWTWVFVRGRERVWIRMRSGRVTDFEHSDGTPVIFKPRQAKRQHAMDILQAPAS